MMVSGTTVYRMCILIWALLLTTCLFAQSPVNVTVQILPPYPNFVDEVMEMNDQTIITLQNTDISNGYSIKLKATLTGSNGIVVRTNESALPGSSIELAPGETVVMTGEELSIFYNNYSENDFDFIGIDRQDIINNQQLPDGTYTICLRAFEYQSGIPLSASSPSGCAVPFVIMAVDPPIITYPQNNTTVATIDPQLLNVNWIPVSVALPDLRYSLEVVDLTDFPMNPYDAFETGNFLFFDEDDIMTNVFLYGMEHPLLIPGNTYAIRVRAYRLDGALNVLNKGYSDIVTFQYGEAEEVPDDAESPDIADQNFECGQNCTFNLAPDQTASDKKPKVGAMLAIGNFQMRVNSITGANPYNGDGVIQATDHLPVGIKVKFYNIEVNAEGRIFAGEAKSVIRSDSWLDHTWSDIETAVDDIQFNPNTLNEAVATLTDPAYYIDNLTAISENVGTTLPFSIGSESNGLQVVGMHFFPHRASYNLSSIIELFDDADGLPRYLNFMAKDLCITPGGIALSADEARLELVQPVRYNLDNKTQLEFQPGSGANSTFLSFDCDGFNGVWAKGDVIFSPDVIQPVDDQGDVIAGDTMVAGFTTSFTSWSDWVATVNFNTQGESTSAGSENRFIYKELEGYIIAVEHAYIDHSIEANPEGMVFPQNYQANSGLDWQGVYLKTIHVTLPKWIKAYEESDERVHLTGNDLIIDGQGLTGVISADNVLTQKEGAMGKWPITVDEVRVKIIQNNLAQAYFSGDLKIPVFEEAFEYSADLQFLHNRTKHTFTFSPVDEYTIPMWYANTTIADNSSLSVHINDGSAYVEASLNGAISFQPVIGDIDKMNLANITFEQFVIRSQAAPKYIEIGNIGTGISGQELAVAGFGVLLESMEWNEKTTDLSSLDLGLAMDLSGDMFGISGSTGIEIKNTINDLVDSLSFEFEGVDIKNIYLEANAGVVDIKGGIAFFKNDEKFGNGFAGNLSVSFIESIKLEGAVLFGNVKPENGDEFNYWYAHALAYLPTTPVPMATPIDIYGFGGGVYKNLSLNRDFPSPRSVHGGSGAGTGTLTEVFNVEKGILGFQASVIVGLTPSSTTFNADVGLTAEINTSTGGLNLLALTGEGYLMQDLREEDKGQSMIKATVAISYDFPNKTLSANFGVDGKIPYQSPMLTLGGEIDIFRSPNLWYLKAGIPTQPMQASINMGISGITANGYFMTGQELPPPVLPNTIKNFFDFDSQMVNNTQNGLGIGFMAGVHLGLDINLSLLGTGVDIQGLAGVDLAVLNYFAATCNGSESFGINKWYAQGQAYLYGAFTLELFTADVAGLELGIIVEGAFPNPTGVKGQIKAEASLLTIEVDFDKKFEVGSFCDIQPMADADELVVREEIELDNLALLGFVTPANGKTNMSTSIEPTVQFFQKDKSLKRFTYGDGLGGIIDKLYRIRNEVKWQKRIDDGSAWSEVIHRATFSTQDSITTLKATTANSVPTLINGGQTYRIVAKSYIEKYKDSQYLDYVYGMSENDAKWEPATYTEGDKQGEVIMEQKIHQFNTGSNLTEIEEMFVDYTLPYPRQRYYPYEYLNTGKIKFNVDHEPKFQDFETCGFDIYAEFNPVDGSTPPPRQKVVRPNLLQAEFDMASLNPETIYKLEIVAERRVTYMEVAQMNNKTCKLPDSEGANDALTTYLADKGVKVNLGNFMSPAPKVTGIAFANIPPVFNLGPATNALNVGYTFSNDTVTHRKVLFTIYFRTSKYTTPEEKMNSVVVSEFTITPKYVNLEFVPQTVVKDVVLKIDCGEGFDKYDLMGHDYETQETKEYFRFSGPSCRSISWSGLNDENVYAWFDRTCPTFINTSGLPINSSNADEYNQSIIDMQATLPGLDIEFKTDPSNYSGIKHIQPLLSDREVGLVSSDVALTYVFLPLYSAPMANGTNIMPYGGIIDLGWVIGGAGGSLSPTTITVNGADGDTELEMIYELDRRAAGMHNYKIAGEMSSGGYIDPDDFPYQHPPVGNYPITIKLLNVAEAQKQNPNFKSRLFNVSIPY